MRIDQIANTLREALAAKVKNLGGRLHVASDPWHPLELIARSPRGVLVVLHWAGDQTGDQAHEDVVAANVLEIYVGNGMNLSAESDLWTMKDAGGRPSLLQLVNDLRAYVLACRFAEDETEEVLEYGGCLPVTLPSGVPLAAYKFTVRLTALVAVDDDLHPLGTVQ